MFAVLRKNPVQSRQVHPGLRHQCRQFGNKIQWFENNLRGAIAVGRVELIADITRGRQ
jgi:hypothetical protein